MKYGGRSWCYHKVKSIKSIKKEIRWTHHCQIWRLLRICCSPVAVWKQQGVYIQPVSLFYMKRFPLLSQCLVPQVQKGRCSTTLKFIPNQLPQTNFNCCRACSNKFICPKNRQYRILLHVLTTLHSSHFFAQNRKYTVFILQTWAVCQLCPWEPAPFPDATVVFPVFVR